MGHEKATAPGPAPRGELAAVVAHRDESMRTALRMLLEDAGYLVRLAADPDTGLEAARALTEPAVVLFEVEPAGQAGAGFLELAVLVAAERESGQPSRRLAFVALTTMPEILPRTLRRLLRRLEVPLVAEPFDVDELLRVVAESAIRSEAVERTATEAQEEAVPTAPKPRTRRKRT